MGVSQKHSEPVLSMDVRTLFSLTASRNPSDPASSSPSISMTRSTSSERLSSRAEAAVAIARIGPYKKKQVDQTGLNPSGDKKAESLQRYLVVSHTSSVEVAVSSDHRPRVVCPSFRRDLDNVVVT